MAYTKEDKEKLNETHEAVIKLKTVLLGANGDKGIVGQVNENTKKVNRNTIILAALLGSGVLTGGGIGIAQLLS